MCNELNLNHFRELCENTIFLEKFQKQFNSNEHIKKYRKDFKKGIKDNKKVAKYYKKIQKLKSKIAKIYGVEYGYDL